MKTLTCPNKSGFTMVEVLISLTILATLMAAVAFAFDASVTNFQQNKGIYETVNRGRQALLRITNDLRTASEVALIDPPGPTLTQDPDNSQIGLLTKDGFMWYIHADKYPEGTPDGIKDTLCLEKDGDPELYTLCGNVTEVAFDRREELVDLGGTVGNIWLVRDVRITLTVTDETGKISKKLAAATLIRKNQYE
ncbi:MAG: PulJ/GspJ family protein [Planctomycetota bacterium]